jgi:hypothetical protein
MPEETHKVGDVFGIGRDLPLNYQTRDKADTVLVDSLTRDKHLVIYGSSKQGKTSLRKHCLQPEDYITVHCSNKWQLHDLHSTVLKRAGFEVTQSTTRTASGKQKIFAKAKIALFGGGAEGGAEAEREKSTEETTAPLELDPEDVNDVIGALGHIKFDQFIVLEDFHYLPLETQKDFAVALKAFHENSPYFFIIIGVWLEENRLTVYNGDLTGRVLSINADEWTREELAEVITAGEELLGISFDDTFKTALLDGCSDSVFIVQEVCYRCCAADKIYETKDESRVTGKTQDASNIIAEVVGQHTGRFNSFITQFADGFQSTELEMYRWLLYPVLTASIRDLGKGLRQKDIRESLHEMHPQKNGLNPGNVTQALLSVGNLQVKKDIKPIVLDYDQTNLRLNVVDRSFLLWLANQDRRELLELAGLPKN